MPDPELQQIMKTIKLQEQQEKQKNEKLVSKAPIKVIEDIEEEMPLSIKGKVRGKSKKSSIKESSKPSTVLSSEEISNAPSCIKSDDAPKGNIPKKDAVFFK